MLFIGTLEGKMDAINTQSHNIVWETPLPTTATSSGFGCSSAPAPVAVYGTPSVGGDLIYVGGYNGRIYAFNTASGLSKDRYLNKDDIKPIVGGPLAALGKVFIGSSDAKVYALDPLSLETVWQYQTDNKIWSSPATDGKGTIFVSSLDKKIYALNAVNGNELWKYETGGAIAATPLYDNGTVYVGSFDEKIYALDAQNGSLKWESETIADNWFWARPVIYNGTVYAPCLDGKVYILDAGTGREIKTITLNSPIPSSPVVAGDSVIVAAQDGKVYAINTNTHQERLLSNLGKSIFSPLAADSGIVYVYTQGSVLNAIDVNTSTTIWKVTFEG